MNRYNQKKVTNQGVHDNGIKCDVWKNDLKRLIQTWRRQFTKLNNEHFLSFFFF
jgi:hypothetical protein